MTGRTVVLLCGPPGAGKSTAAKQSGLDVFDFDDPQWKTRARFNATIASLARDPHAQAVVITAGATSSARAKMAARIGATHTYLLTADPDELRKRIAIRGRPEKKREWAGVAQWFARFDHEDQIEMFTGWDALPTEVVTQSNATERATETRPVSGNITVRDW